LRSIFDQTCQDFEVIYLDDCSTDNSEEIVAEVASDGRIRCFRNARNSGSPFIQINKGVRLARGELIWIAEADDYADPEFLESLVPVLSGNPLVGLVYCRSMVIDEEDKVITSIGNCGKYLPVGERWERDFVRNGMQECREFLIYDNTIPNVSAVLFRRNIFQQIGYADESMKLCGDWLTWINMLMISDIAFVAKPLNYFRWHTLSVRFKIDVVRKMREMYNVFEYCRKNMALSDQEMNILLTKNMKMWTKKMIRERPVGWVRDTLSLFKVALHADPKFMTRFLWYLADYSSFGLSRKARRRLGIDILAKIPKKPPSPFQYHA
jgi:glycosyltransferase involved in cell wall biosynthesis